jgi:hypothetical protein
MRAKPDRATLAAAHADLAGAFLARRRRTPGNAVRALGVAHR